MRTFQVLAVLNRSSPFVENEDLPIAFTDLRRDEVEQVAIQFVEWARECCSAGGYAILSVTDRPFLLVECFVSFESDLVKLHEDLDALLYRH